MLKHVRVDQPVDGSGLQSEERVVAQVRLDDSIEPGRGGAGQVRVPLDTPDLSGARGAERGPGEARPTAHVEDAPDRQGCDSHDVAARDEMLLADERRPSRRANRVHLLTHSDPELAESRAGHARRSIFGSAASTPIPSPGPRSRAARRPTTTSR